MRDFTLIHLSLGGCPQREHAFLFRGHASITATYWDGLTKVGAETVPVPVAMGLCDPWFEGDECPSCGEKDVRVKCDWPVDFGRARTLEGRMKKALTQVPDSNEASHDARA